MTYTPRHFAGQPAFIDLGYKSTAKRGPTQKLVKIPPGRGEVCGPSFGSEWAGPLDADLTRNGRVNGEPVGERILVTGRVLDEVGQAVPNTLIEIWQANASGRYVHKSDQHDAPIDPNFRGSGRCITNDEGYYRFTTIKPGAYPWRNHHNAWRPNHIHFSLLGAGFASRLVTQMYFPGDPLLDLDPIYNSVPAVTRGLMVARFDLDRTKPEWALGFAFDIVLRGPVATPME